MSKLEELIRQYCPDGVEYKSLGTICKTLPKGTLTTKELVEPEGNYPVINSGRDLYGYYHSFNNEGNAFTIAARGEYAGYISFFEEKFWAGGLCYPYRSDTPQISTKYVYYYLKSKQEYIRHTLVAEGSIPALNKSIIDKFEIPVPPLPVQEEIVRILDTFTELQAGLQAELQKRKLQYNYYRDNLLSFQGRTDVEWKKLGDVASIKTGRRFVRTDITESGVPCFHYGDLYTYYGLTATQTKGFLDKELAKKLRFAQPNDVVVVCAGENDMDIGVGVAWLGDEPAVVHDACCILHHNQNPRFISHFLRTHNYHLQMKKYVKNGKISSLPASGLAEALIPLPSLEEQKKIADILDRFDRLTGDLSSGLPAEMEKRRQQYEYYRDKLLTFKRISD